MLMNRRVCRLWKFAVLEMAVVLEMGKALEMAVVSEMALHSWKVLG